MSKIQSNKGEWIECNWPKTVNSIRLRSNQCASNARHRTSLRGWTRRCSNCIKGHFTNNLFLFPAFVGRFGRIIITSKDGDKNLIRHEVFRELRVLDETIQNATVTYDGDTFTYQDICGRWDGECFLNDILDLDAILDDVSIETIFVPKSFAESNLMQFLLFEQIISGEVNFTFPVLFNPSIWYPHVLPVFFGGTVRTGDIGSEIVVSVPSLQLIYFPAVDTKRQLDK